MLQSWIKDYMLLALGIDKAFNRMGDGPFVDCFYGPADLKAFVDAEPEKSAESLTRAAKALRDSLPAQGFEQQRAEFLDRQVRAMEVFCRWLGGQDDVLQEEIQQCLDIQPKWKPEAEFEQALALLDQALPGSGNLRQRYSAWLKRATLPLNRPTLVLPLMQRLLAEARHRTQRLVVLPGKEELEVYTVQEKPYGAANWYLGNYRSRMELNLGRPINLLGLLYQMCHEGYPGHHTEFVLKEKHLYHDRGFREQAIFVIGPQLVIAEGIASLALEMIFSPDEIADWVTEWAHSELGNEIGEVDLPKLIRANAANALDDLGNNLVMMLWGGYSEEDLMAYAWEYTPHTEAQIRGLLQSLNSPLKQVYAFTYYQGKRLMKPLLQGDDRALVFRRLLTEQVYPARLVE